MGSFRLLIDVEGAEGEKIRGESSIEREKKVSVGIRNQISNLPSMKDLISGGKGTTLFFFCSYRVQHKRYILYTYRLMMQTERVSACVCDALLPVEEEYNGKSLYRI